MRGDRKGESDVHAAGVMFDRGVDKLLNFGKGHYLIKLLPDLGVLHAEDRTVQKDILAPGQLRLKACAHFEQRSNPAVNISVAFSRFGNAREDLEQRALPRSVAADDADDFAVLYFERNVLQGPDGFGFRFADRVAIATGKKF